MNRTFSPAEREASMTRLRVKVPAFETSGLTLREKIKATGEAAGAKARVLREPRIKFYSPSQLKAYQPDKDIVLVGDNHIMLGEVFVIGGEPGVGKSRGATALAVSGATERPWFGLPVHRRFRTMIVQTENGLFRLQQEFASLGLNNEIEDWIRVCEPPPFGLTLTNSEFQKDIKAELQAFRPECVIIDPWAAATKDSQQRDYSETFDAIRNILPTGKGKPALGIVAHTRKPKTDEKRTGGTGLMHLLAGSYILTSVPRAIFVMIRGSEEETDDSVVLCNPKNSNGPNSARSAWHRNANGFSPNKDFDWSEFDKSPDKRVIVRLDHLSEVFEGGKLELELKDAAHALASLTGINERSAYNALAPDGRFTEHLSRKGNKVCFRP
jgi:hypothetical protein